MCGVSVVNGYMCYTSCQAAAARAGKDPHAPPGQSDHQDKANGLAGQPPSILDPGPKDLANAVNPANAAGASNSDYQASPGVNLLV
jgi:hypothetical protein